MAICGKCADELTKMSVRGRNDFGEVKVVDIRVDVEVV